MDQRSLAISLIYLVDKYVVLPRKDRLPTVNTTALPQVKLTLICRELPLSQTHGSSSVRVMGLDSHAVIASWFGIENLDQKFRGQEYGRRSIVYPGIGINSEKGTSIGRCLVDDIILY